MYKITKFELDVLQPFAETVNYKIWTNYGLSSVLVFSLPVRSQW